MGSTKKGWKAVRETVGDMPNPTSSCMQKALAFHSVMVSGMTREMSAFPAELRDKRARDEREENRL